MINFYIPDFIRFYDLNYQLVILLKKHPEYFYNNIQIKGIYGCLPSCIWNGGRSINYYSDTPELTKIVKTFNSLDVSIRYTFTNSKLQQEHLFDIRGNMMMTIANNGMNDIIIYSEILEKYLRKKYPNFKYISSITKCLTNNQDIINEFKKEYDFVVIDQIKNRDFELLKSLDNNKIELLINSYCFPYCNMKKLHYENVSNYQLIQRPDYFKQIEQCKRAKTFKDILEFFTTIKREELFDIYYKQLGIYNFKIEGRTNSSFELLENYLYFLVKPEYNNLVKNYLLPYCKEDMYI